MLQQRWRNGNKVSFMWKKIKTHPVATVLIALLAVVIVLIILINLGYICNWDWAGLGRKTLWDWLQLLIIPVVLALGGYLFTFTISSNERKAADRHNQAEREIAQDNQCEAALQEYIDKMSELLLHEKLRESQPENEVRTIARVQTLTVLPRLDKARKRTVLLFLYESGLIKKGQRIVDLDGADLSNVDLFYVNLNGADLSKVNLREANLFHANLSGANLILTVLTAADLGEADLNGANLEKAFLDGGTVLSFADLSGANLQGTILKGTNLQGTKVTSKQLDEATFFEGVTLPDGSKHP
jgi:pentapeptide repeat protein